MARRPVVTFESDRSFEIIVRLPESVRADLQVLSNLPLAPPKATPNSTVQSMPLNRVTKFTFVGANRISREKRQAPYRRHCERARP